MSWICERKPSNVIDRACCVNSSDVRLWLNVTRILISVQLHLSVNCVLDTMNNHLSHIHGYLLSFPLCACACITSTPCEKVLSHPVSLVVQSYKFCGYCPELEVCHRGQPTLEEPDIWISILYNYGP